MQSTTFRNFQPNDHIKTKNGEVFEVTERLTYFCKECDCKPLNPCDEFKEKSILTIKSQRGIWEMSLQEINRKLANGDITETKWT
jgi:hypothetical protein